MNRDQEDVRDAMTGTPPPGLVDPFKATVEGQATPAPASGDISLGAVAGVGGGEAIEQRILEKFESAWRNTLQGAPSQPIESFVQEAPESMRFSLLKELARLEQVYRVRFNRAHSMETMGGDRAAETLADAELMHERIARPAGPGDGATIDSNNVNLGHTIADDSAGFVIAREKPKPKETSGPPKPEVKGYEILDELGRGGMGVVYKARQLGLNRIVALKMVLAGAHAGADQLARFQVEAEAVANLQHPNIVQIFEVGEQDGLPYFSLEFIDGGSLAAHCGGKPLPQKEAAKIVEQLAHGMAFAHDNQIIHRDLKPANVLLTRSLAPKITDFGLAKKLEGDSSQTRSGTLMGTPSYMAPEQAKGDIRATGPLSDQYALGAIFYELLTGRPPFQGATLLDTLEQVRTQEPVPPSRLQPKIAKDAETICLKCLQKDPKQRYPQTGDLAEDLRRFIAGEPITARPIGKLEQAWRWCRRKPLEAALYAAVAGVVLMLISVGFYFWSRSVRDGELVENTRRSESVRLQNLIKMASRGEAGRVKDLLSYKDPNVQRNPKLADLRLAFTKLEKQVDAYLGFKDLLDKLRYMKYLRGAPMLEESRKLADELLGLSRDIEDHKGKGAYGMPELNEARSQYLKEDLFDAFLLAADNEASVATRAKDETAKQAGLESALKLLNKADAVIPGTRALHTRRSELYSALKKPAEAKADQDRALAIAVNSPLEHFYHGYSEHLRAVDALKRKDQRDIAKFYGGAQSEFAAVLRDRPESFWSYFEWSECMVELNNLDQAFLGFTACIDIDPEPPWPYNNRGVILHRQGKNREALVEFDKAISRDRHYEAAYSNRALARQALGQWTEARDDLTKAIAANPKNFSYYFQRGQVSFQLKQYAPARDDFTKVIELNPGALGAYANRAQMNLGLKDFSAFLADLEYLHAQQPNEANHVYLIAAHHMAKGDYDESLKWCRKALEIKADQPMVRLMIAEMHHWNGRLDEALSTINVVVNVLDSKNAWYLNDRPDVLRTMGKPEEALADCRKSIELDPQKPDAYVTASLILSGQGKYSEARSILDDMVKSCASAEAYLRRSEYLASRGEFGPALADCARAAELDKESPLPGLGKAAVWAAEGKPAEATAEAGRLESKIAYQDGHALLAAARVWGLAAKAYAGADKAKSTQALARAGKLLIEAVTIGFFDLNYQELNRLRDDPAFAEVRTLPEVGRLVWFRLPVPKSE